MSEKVRVQNFTPSEKLHLLQIISRKYASIIEDKKTNRASGQKKERTWQKIADDFNATSSTGILRSMASLKKCYENRKKELRKTLADEKREARLTGGGPLLKIKRDDVDELLLSIINKNTLAGFQNKFDDDDDGNERIIVCRDPDDDEEINAVEILEYIEDEEMVPDHYSKSTSSKSYKRPTTSDISKKYNLLLDKRLMLVERQLNHMEEENALIIRKRELEIEILETELLLKQKNLE